MENVMSQTGKAPLPPGATGGGFLARLAPNVIGFFSSGAIMVLEIIAGRLVSPSVGSSQYTWTSIIGVILAGMSIGNWLGGRLADRYPPIRTVWILFLVSTALILLTMPLSWYALPPLKTMLIPYVIDNPGGESRKWGLSVLLMMTVVWIWPAIALGLTSPVLAKMALDANPSSGRAVGNFYTWGAVGMILGTFATGYQFQSFLSVEAIILLVAATMALLGVLTGLPVWLGRAGAPPASGEVAK
jgi:MFS family permease